jgi:F-type H+-transporting ATPase subunit gamma
MPTLRQITSRIRSVRSTAKTTRAMSLVAGSKMRRAQQMALAHRPYAEQLHWLLADVVESLNAMGGPVEGETSLHPLLERREIVTHGLIVLTPDRGLCGGLPTSLIRRAGAYVVEHPETKIIAVGRKGVDFFRRTRRDSMIGEFQRLGDYPSYDDSLPISRLVMDAYTSGEVDSVDIIYPNFINTVLQRPDTLELLPVSVHEDAETKDVEYIYEPDAGSVLTTLMPRYVEVEVYRAVLEMAASEQSARMVAMRNATDAAQELIEQLTLLRNKVRQEQITKELLDITGGVEAMAAHG